MALTAPLIGVNEFLAFKNSVLSQAFYHKSVVVVYSTTQRLCFKNYIEVGNRVTNHIFKVFLIFNKN